MSSSLTKPTILIVEDESVVARDIIQQLGELGYEPVGHATTGVQAIALAGQLRPSLVLMDIKLAGEMDGITAAHAIRDQFSLPVVFLTAFAENETLAQAKLSEPFGYIIKPFSERELHTVIQMALHRHQMETRLRRSEERLRLVLLGSTDAFWDHDLVKGEVFRSARWAEMLGYAEDELVGGVELWTQLMHPDDIARATQIFETARQSDLRHYEVEVRLRHKAGHYVPILSRAAIVRDALGSAVRVTGTNTDLTERKQTEDARVEALSRLQKVASRLPGVIYQFRLRADGTACVPYASAGFNEVYGVDVERIRDDATELFSAIHPEDCERVVAAIRQSARDLTPWRQEFRVRTPDNTFRWLLGNSLPEREADGATLWHGFVTDVTERRETEHILRLRGAALEAAANTIVITNRDGIIEWANPAFVALSGWTLAEAVGKNPRDLVKSGEHSPAFYQQMWETLLAGKVWRGDVINRRKDGALRTENMTITPLRDERDEITHFIAIKQDVTDQKAMETHFLKAQRMEAIGALAGGIAHDLNNILAPIMMVTGVLRNQLSNQNDRELLAMAQASAQRGAEIIKQLLTFSRGQEGERTLVQPRHLIGEMTTMMRETFPRDIDLQQNLPGMLWTVVADPTQLHQVLLNLCVNARDAMPTGGRLLLAAANLTLAEGDPRLPPRSKSGPYVVIEVSDTGHGIPAEIRHRIFDPFFTTKPLGKGTGLGLSTVLGIVQNHGGFVDLDSSSHAGSTFKIYLPAVPDGVQTDTPASSVPPAPAPSGEMILVVDDERNIRDSIRLILEANQYRVVTATDGEQGLAQFLKHRAQLKLVLTDLMMPKMNGLTLIRTLRAIDPTVKIVATSGLSEVTERRELAALGVPEVLMKPYDGPALLDVVQRWLPAS